MENLKKLINELCDLSSKNSPTESIKDDINEAFVILFQTKIGDRIAGIIEVDNTSDKGPPKKNKLINGTLETISQKIQIKYRESKMEKTAEATNVVRQLFKYKDFVKNKVNDKKGMIINAFKFEKIDGFTNFNKISKVYEIRYFDKTSNEWILESNLIDLNNVYEVGDYVIKKYEDKSKISKYVAGLIIEIKQDDKDDKDDKYNIQWLNGHNNKNFKKIDINLKCRFKIKQKVKYTTRDLKEHTGIIQTINVDDKNGISYTIKRDGIDKEDIINENHIDIIF